MSLSTEPTDENSRIIAVVNVNKEKSNIYINDVDEDTKLLKKMRLNNLEDFIFPYIPDLNDNSPEMIYISGPTGCGKSTFIRDYINHFKSKYPKSKILLFSSKTKDELLDGIKNLIRWDIDEDMLTNKLTLDEINYYGVPVLVVFDDIESFPTKKLNVEIERLRDEILLNGRSRKIYGLFVHHDPTDYQKTKLLIKECNKHVIFPRRAGVGIYDRLFSMYLHIPKDLQKLMYSTKSKFVMINKNIPRYILSDRYIILF